VRLMLRRDAACRRFGTPSPNVSHSSAMTHDCLLERSKVDRQLFLLSLSLSLMEKGQGLLRCTSSFLFAPTDESIFRIYLPQCNYHRDRGDTSERSPRAVATRILLTTPLRPPPPPLAAPLPLRGVSGISGCGLGGLCGRATVRRSPEPSETKRPLKRMRSERTAGKREIAKSKPRRGPWRGLSGPPPFPIHPRHPIRRPSSPAGQI